MRDNISNVTVNGRPVGEYIAKNQPRKIRNKPFTNGVSRNLNIPDEDNPDFTQWVVMNGVQYLRAAKEPIGKSGKSLIGAFQYDPDTDKLKCHECGEWFVHYGLHRQASSAAHINATEYRKRHGFKLTTAIAGLRFRRGMSEKRRSRPTLNRSKIRHEHLIQGGNRKTIESLNVNSNCPLQIPHRLQLLAADLGRTPTIAEVKAAKISLSAMRHIFGSYAECMLAAGLNARRPSQHLAPRAKGITDPSLIGGLLAFHKIHGGWPTKRQIDKCGFMANSGTYRRRFGGLPQAIAKAESRLHQNSQPR